VCNGGVGDGGGVSGVFFGGVLVMVCWCDGGWVMME